MSYRDSHGSQIPLCFLLFPSPPPCTDVGYHAGLVVVGGVLLCLPSFAVDIFFFFYRFGFGILVTLSVFMEIFREI